MYRFERTLWERLGITLRKKIISHLDPSTKLNLSLCSRKTYNEMVGRMEYFGTLIFKYIELNYNFYQIDMSYENNGDSDSYIEFVEYSEEREKRYNEKEDRYESESESDSFDDSESDEDSDCSMRKRRKLYEQTKIKSRNNAVECQTKLDQIIEDGDMGTVASNYFKRILAKHYWHIQAIDINVPNIDLFDMKIERFPYLDDLAVSNMVAFCYFITRTSRKLKTLTLNSFQDKWMQTSIRSIMSFQQIYEVTDCFDAELAELLYEEFSRLNAEMVCLYFHETMGVEKINKYIHSWKNGEIRNNMKFMIFDWTRNLDVEKVLDGVENIELDSRVYHLKYSTIENGRVYRTINNVDPNSYMDIVYSGYKFVLAVNNEKSNLRTKHLKEKPSHVCNVNFCCQKSLLKK